VSWKGKDNRGDRHEFEFENEQEVKRRRLRGSSELLSLISGDAYAEGIFGCSCKKTGKRKERL
jgi:hypothetical protein